MNFIVDTSVWIDHLHTSDSKLVAALDAGTVLVHPYVIGELACGTLRNRRNTLMLLSELPRAPIATHNELMVLIETRGLMGRGLNYIDVHLLASAALADNARLWTTDRRLAEIARAESFGLP